MSKETVIRLESACKEYSRGSEIVHAVRDISFSIYKSDYLAVTGHSGSGKTTLLNLIGCLDRPSSGVVEVNGFLTAQTREKELAQLRKHTIGFIFQQFFLIPTLSVKQNVMLPALFAGTNAAKRAEELLEMVGLQNRLSHLPGQLSGGEMQRVAIARSLINKPPILLADEPTGNLDTRNAEGVMDILDNVNSLGVTVIMVTHNLELARRCARILRMEDGRLKDE